MWRRVLIFLDSGDTVELDRAPFTRFIAVAGTTYILFRIGKPDTLWYIHPA